MSEHEPPEPGDTAAASAADRPSNPVLVALAWLVVGVPLGYGLEQTIAKASALFTGG